MSEQQNDPSEDQPIEGRDWSKSPVPHRQCTGHRKNGDRCKNAAIVGGTVCKFHGGAAKHVRNAARVRLQNAADRMARELLRMAVDDNVSDSVKLAAIKDALDRAGLNSKTEIELSARPWEQIEETVVAQLEIRGSRADYRRSHGIADDSDDADPLAQLQAQDTAKATRDSDPYLDVAVVDVSDSGARGHTDTRDGWDWPASERTAGEATPSRPGLLPIVDAVEQAAELRRARVHPLALPPGRQG